MQDNVKMLLSKHFTESTGFIWCLCGFLSSVKVPLEWSIMAYNPEHLETF